jgi:SSS family solute:Na+ symporter
MEYFVGIYIVIISILNIIYENKVKTVKDYIIGSNNNSTFVLIAAILGLMISGTLLITRSKMAYEMNFVYLLGCFGSFFRILSYCFIAPYLYKKYRDKISVGEILQDSYGLNARRITGLCGLILSILYIAAQMKVFALFLHYLFGMEILNGLILCLCFVLSYSLFGGARLISINMFFKFYILLIIIPLIFGDIMQKFGGFIEFFNHPIANSLYSDLIKIDIYKSLTIFFICALPLLSQPIISVIFMGKDAKQSSSAFLGSSFIFIILLLILTLRGFIIYIINPNLVSNFSFFYILEYINHSYKPLLVVGIISIITVSIDAYLNGGSVSLVRDLVKTILPKIEDKVELSYMKFSNLFIMLAAFIVAILFDNFLDLIIYSSLLWVSIITMPLLFAIFSDSKKINFYKSLIFTLISIIIWKIFDLENLTFIDPVIICFSASFLACITTKIFSKNF